MAKSQCEDCSFRAKYDSKPESILGKIWRWHANWCPGWKKYVKSLPDADRTELAEKYNMPKYK